MKVLFVTNLLPPHFIGGYEIACLDTYKLFKKNDVNCILLTSNYVRENVENQYLEFEGVHRVLKIHTDFKLDKNCESYSIVESYNAKILSEYCNNYKPDIIYFWNIWGLGTEILNCYDPRKCVYHIMDLSIKQYDYSELKYLKYVLLKNRPRPILLKNKIRNIIFISDFISNRFKNHQFKNQNVIYPFLKKFDSELVKENYLKNSNNFKGVYVGQIEKHKGVVELCSVISDINSKFAFNLIELDLYGSSLSGLDNLLKSKYGFINIIENTSRIQILKQLKNYDFGFFPSIWEEPFGIAQIEMMAAGLPVFTSARGGSKEAVNRYNSIIYSDLTELKNLITNFISNYSNLASSIGKNARNDISNKFSENLYFKKIILFFKTFKN
uniref:glycosyltransferase n=1 Tax=Algoriphagus sp. TaxID=1872435 RepID=UPI00404740BB